jgi:hypothetical protein
MDFGRLARMDVDEISWRAKSAARIAWDRIRISRTPPAWDRHELAPALAADASLNGIRSALADGDWHAAHRALGFHIAFTPQRFALAASNHSTLAPKIRDRFPRAPAQATARAERVVGGRYDLLGYSGLTFADGRQAIDWHFDPVHDCHAPKGFWSDVPYLDPECGDHKIIWELNRHQHWFTLGRAFWLTGDVRYRQRFLMELSSWLEANPPLTGINWASMLELGFRCISWTWALAFFADLSTADEEPWIVDLLLALDRQLTHIEQNLSYYFSPNTHLLGEALALYVCSRSLPLLRCSPEREELGRRVLLEEARRQIGSDGGHVERSTHYHRYTLDFYLLALVVARITKDPAAGEFQRAVLRLTEAARLLADDEGMLPQIGDDDGGMLFPMTGRPPGDIRDSLAAASVLLKRQDLRIGEVPEEVYWLLANPSFKVGRSFQNRRGGDPANVAPHRGQSGALRDTGYYISNSTRGDHLVIDGGVHGYLNGGHAHADALSLTLTVAGVPLLVDPGTGAYTIDKPLRDRLRSSQMHNTLVVDDRSQSTAKGPFSWSTVARSHVRRWKTHKVFDYFEGVHDGYHPIEHRRHVLTRRGDLMVVADLVTGQGAHTASIHWHVDPRWRVAVHESAVTFATKDAQCQLVVPRGRIERFDGDARTGLGWQAPMYGSVQPSTSLRVTNCDELPFWMVSVFGLNRANAVVEAEFLPVSADAGVLASSLSLRIVRQSSIDYVAFADPSTKGGTWRTASVETDARVLFCREQDGRLGDVFLLDGSRVRANVEPPIEFETPHRVEQVHLNGDPERAALRTSVET